MYWNRTVSLSVTAMRGVEHIPWLYDGLMSLIDALGLARWRDALIRGARGRILDVGCGTGRNLPRYAKGTEVIGLDPDLTALVRARRRAPGIPLVAGRVEALPFRAEAFDAVISSLVFCSVDDPVQGLLEIRRVLRQEGELRMLEHVRARRLIFARMQDRLQPLWTRVTGGCRPNRDTEAGVESVGFGIEPEERETAGVLRRFRARPVRQRP